MPSPTLGDLAKRVAALELENARLKALSTPGAGAGVLLDADTPEIPTRDAFEVRSELTGAIVGRHDSYEHAGDEADRLNDECRRDGIRHRGDLMRYAVEKVRVTDETALRDLRIDELKAQIDDKAFADQRERLIAELHDLEQEGDHDAQ